MTVTFHTQSDNGAVKWQPVAVTDKAGKFTLRTGAGGDGAMPDEYKVMFEILRVESDRKNSGIEVEVDAWKGKHSHLETAPKVTVSAAGGELDPFRLE